MYALAIVVLVFAILQLSVAIVNLVFKAKLKENGLRDVHLISVLIPARNEEQNIRVILSDLIGQSYRNLEIIVFDDQSDDLTPSIVREMAGIDKRIKLVGSDNLPEGWLGKNFACHSMALLAKGDFLLFMDADVRIGNSIIGSATDYAKRNKLGLLSIFPLQILRTTGERLTVPIMNYILLTLLPLPLVQQSRFASLSAANGQFMLFEKQNYLKTLPHNHFKGNKAEDIAIAQFFKKMKINVACLSGDNSIQCRMYTSFNDAINGFSKNITAFFGDSTLLAILFWVITSLGFMPVFISLPLNIFLLYLLVLFLTRVIVSLVSRQSILMNVLFIIPHQLVIGLLIFKSLKRKYSKSHQWKGRNLAS